MRDFKNWFKNRFYSTKYKYQVINSLNDCPYSKGKEQHYIIFNLITLYKFFKTTRDGKTPLSGINYLCSVLLLLLFIFFCACVKSYYTVEADAKSLLKGLQLKILVLKWTHNDINHFAHKINIWAVCHKAKLLD